MAIVHARLPFQLYKADEPEATVQSFNSLAPEIALPYKVASAEEVLAASLDLVEEDETARSTYAVSVIHSASVYLNLLGSYIPLMSRSQSARKVTVNYSLLARTVALYGEGSAPLVEAVRKLVAANTPAEALSIPALSDLERSVTELEKRYRQEAKQSGAKVELLRKVAPPPSSTASTSPLSGVDQGVAGGPLAAEDEESNTAAPPSASQTSATKRRRSTSARVRRASVDGGAGPDPGDEETYAQMIKLEDGVTAVGGTPAAGKPTAKRTVTRAKPATQLVVGRLRALTSGEKRAVAALNQMIEVLAHVYATRYNNLIPILDDLQERMTAVQAIVDAERAAFSAKEDQKPPEPFHETTLEGIAAALAASTQTFRDEDECRYELDEDLLHPIAHACLEVVNQIEGYTTAPFVPPTAEELERKRAARDAAREKRESAARRLLERARAREELAQRKEDERRLMRARLGGALDEDELQEDTTILNPVPSAYVHYEPSLPLGSVDLYERALFIWSVLVSLPRPLRLSQLPFSLFVKGLEEEDQEANGLMQEITQCLLELSMAHVRETSPNTPRIMTRGKNWFDALVEFVAVASGNRKKRQQQRRRAPSTESDDDESEDESDSDEDSSSYSSTSLSSSGSGSAEEASTPSSAPAGSEEASGKGETPAATGSKESAAAAAEGSTAADAGAGGPVAEPEAEEEEDTDSFSAELKATTEHIAQLRSLATWGNVDMIDRLNLLQFCVLEALASEPAREEADRLLKEYEEDAAEVERSVREAREAAEKELRGILRSLSATTTISSPTSGRPRKSPEAGEGGGDAEDYETRKARILQEAEKKRRAAYARLFRKQDSHDVGVIIQPLGTDRYRRVYWRFPLDDHILVQTTAETALDKVPRVAEPESERQRRRGTSRFLDDHEEEEELVLLGSNRRRGARGAGDGDGAAKSKVAGARAATMAGGEPSTHAPGEATSDGEDGPQRVWGTIAPEYLPTFIEGLDPRGVREAALRRTLEEMVDYLKSMEKQSQDGRVTRARAHTFGYLNKLKLLY